MLDYSQGVEPPYITNQISGIGGRLRTAAEDFQVEEIPLYEPVDEGQHLYVQVTKTGLTTKAVERQLQQLFNLPRGAVGFAGMKDKHAVTTQTFSLNVGHRAPEFADEAIRRIADALPVTVNWARFHRNKLKAGHLRGNRFLIVIRDIDLPTEIAIERTAAVVEQLRQGGLPNYFGPQRFGIEGKNIVRGLAVLQGKEYVKEKWLRRFLISAYQSFLCNCYLGARLERDAFRALLMGDVAKKYATGGLFDVEDLEAEQQRYAAHEISFTAPLFGGKMRSAQQAAGALEAEILSLTPITVRHFTKARIDGTRRLGRILLPDISLTPIAEPNAEPNAVDKTALQIAFSLPKGAFATTVLREIMKTDLAHMPEIDDE